jgi:hypothetical protein
MTAGGRTLIMLPKISMTKSHRKMMDALSLRTEMPRNLLQHWDIFKDIAAKTTPEHQWQAEVLFFPHQWFKRLSDRAWLKFQNYLLQTAWDGSEYWRNEFIGDMVFASILEKQNIKPDAYFINTVKHLFAIGSAGLPGLAPAIDDMAGPISLIQKIYREVYDIKYAPAIMQPEFFNSTDNLPVYYSLEYPMLFEMVRKRQLSSNKLSDLVYLSRITEKFCKEINKDNLNLEDTQFFDVAKKIKFDFLHTTQGREIGIKHSASIEKEDARFMFCSRNNDFPESCSFLRGCIRIMNMPEDICVSVK